MSVTIRVISSSMPPDWSPGQQAAMSLTSFWGGDVGRCLQLTLGGKFIGLGELEVRRLQSALAMWLDPDITAEKIAYLLDEVERGS